MELLQITDTRHIVTDEQDLLDKIELLRERNNITHSNHSRHDFQFETSEPLQNIASFSDVMIVQAIVVVIILIVILIVALVNPKLKNQSIDTIVELATNDFSFDNLIYQQVDTVMHYLEELHVTFPESDNYSPSTDTDNYTPSANHYPSTDTDNYLPSADRTTSTDTSYSPSTDADDYLPSADRTTSTDTNTDSMEGMGGSTSNELLIPPDVTTQAVIFTGNAYYPIEDGRETSYFGIRDNPFTGAVEFHNGLDIATYSGANIYAVQGGTVGRVWYSSGLGNSIRIDHSDSFSTTYSHCSEIIATEGTVIRQGEVIAKVGSSGQSTGNHLHLTATLDGINFNPQYLFTNALF